MRELFVWYRVAAPHVEAARLMVVAMQRQLAADFPGLQARLLCRAGDGSSAATWMETYACRGRPSGVDGAIEAAIEAQALPIAALLDGGRHCEAFIAASAAS